MKKKAVDVLILGAGVAGLMPAWLLAKEGVRTTLAEAGEAGQACSWAGAGILFPLLPWEMENALSERIIEGARAWEELSASLFSQTDIDPQYRKTGLLLLPPFDEDKAKDWLYRHGYAFTQEVSLPGVGPKGWFLPEVAQIRNPRLLRALKKAAQNAGVDIHEHHLISRLEKTQEGFAAHGKAGSFLARKVVIAAGAWSAGLMAGLGDRLEVFPVQGEILLYHFSKPPVDAMVYADDLYLVPREDGHLLLGSTMRQVGFDTAVGDEGWLLHHRAAAIVPALLGKQPIRRWAGLRPGNLGGVPFAGEHPRIENLFLHTGHFRYGITLSPVTAKEVVAAVLAKG